MGFHSTASPGLRVRGNPSVDVSRRCHFELMEPRQLLAADLATGALGGDFGVTGGETGSISGSVFAAQAVVGCEAHAASNSLAGVRVQLLDASGKVVEESLTDEQGGYRFSDLIPGEYSVRQEMPNGYVDGSAHIGDGGGIALGMNQVGEIAVQAGETLTDYDFCDFATVPEFSGPTDRPIVPHDEALASQDLVIPILVLTLQETTNMPPSVVSEQPFESPTGALIEQPTVLETARQADIFGGSSRSLKEPTAIRDWDEDPIDGWISTASYLELADTNRTARDAVVAVLGNEIATERFDDETAENSAQWSDTDVYAGMDQLMGDQDVIQLGSNETEPTPPAQIARRPKAPQTDKSPRSDHQQQDAPAPVRSRTAEQIHTDAMDHVLTYENPSDTRADQVRDGDAPEFESQQAS